MDWYEPEVRALEARQRAGQWPAHPAVFYGSSSIRMWTEMAVDLRDPRALNLGFGGSTLAACAYFFARLVPASGPASLVLYAGDNDLGDGCAPKAVLASFCSLAAQVNELAPSIPFGFLSIKISPARVGLRDRIRETNALIQDALKEYPEFYYIDVAHAMLDVSGAPRAELFLEDGLHLSRAGYHLWARLLEPFRNRIFIPPLPDVGTELVS